MAEEYEDKTEEPTPKRLADAKKKGIVAKSQDLTIALMLMCSMVVLYFFSGYMYRHLSELSIGILSNLHFDYFNPDYIAQLFNWGIWQIGIIVAPALLSALAFALLFNLIQTGFVFSSYPLSPKWNKLNVFDSKNYERNFSWQTVFRLGLSLLRINLLVVINIGLMCLDVAHLRTMSNGSVYEILKYIFIVTLIPGFAISATFIVIAAADYMYQRWRYRREMRMSRREVRDEMKMLEGDLHVRSKIRAMMRSFATLPLPTLVSHADLLVADGGHIAVALQYEHGKMEVPIVIYKGKGGVALEMRALAGKCKVPIVENSPLAQALFRGVGREQSIRPEHYLQVATALAQAT